LNKIVKGNYLSAKLVEFNSILVFFARSISRKAEMSAVWSQLERAILKTKCCLLSIVRRHDYHYCGLGIPK